jgi:hypothetical protein
MGHPAFLVECIAFPGPHVQGISTPRTRTRPLAPTNRNHSLRTPSPQGPRGTGGTRLLVVIGCVRGFAAYTIL